MFSGRAPHLQGTQEANSLHHNQFPEFSVCLKRQNYVAPMQATFAFLIPASGKHGMD
jgi:hypothetical protein